MRVRLFEIGRDYPEICEWWRQHGWEYLAVSKLGEMGLVVEDDTQKYCAAWLYFMSGGWAMLEFLVSNPKSSLKKRPAAIKLLVSESIPYFRARGVHSIYSMVKQRGLVSLFEKSGFNITNTEMTEMIMRIST